MSVFEYLRTRATVVGLRRLKPEAPDELVRALTLRIANDRARRRGVRLRTATAGALTASLSLALFGVGGVSYAANALQGATKVVQKAVAPAAKRERAAVVSISAGRDQYRPGYGFGDPNHNHTGPPGLRRSGGAAAPPLRAQPVGSLARTVAASVNLTEQATLFISVVDRAGKPLLLTQRSRRGGSIVGTGISGPQTKFIRYQVLVPRAIPLVLRVPANLLKRGQTYRIRVVAIDPQGNRSTLFVPFRA